MAKNATFIIFLIYLIHSISALPHHQIPDEKTIAEVFEEADQFFSFIKTIPSEDHNVPISALDIQSGLFGNIFSEPDDELVLSCIVKYKDDYAKTLNNNQKGAKLCILRAQEKVLLIAMEINDAKDQINEHIENLKTVIDDCLDKNTATNLTLQCIENEITANIQGIIDGVQEIKKYIVEGWAEVKRIAKKTKKCLEENAEKGSKDIIAVVQNVSNCINPNE